MGVWVTRQRVTTATAPREGRFLEARLSGGLSWAPFETNVPRTRTLAATVVRGEKRHAEALSQLLDDRADTAISQLTTMASASRDPAVWSDLGAAHFAAGHLEDALAATDQALLFDPRYAESRFNRALILERFHFRDVAAAAWRDFLAVAPADGWRGEAARHLAALEAPLRTFASEIDTHYPRMQRGDRAAARTLLELDAGDTRYFGETEGLARWGEAWLRRDTSAANSHLTAIRTLAAELVTFNGEAMPADAVAAIEGANATQRDALARGHVACRDGRLAYDARNMGEAEKLLTESARELEGSPYATQARLFAATSKLYQGRHDEARAEYAALAPLMSERHAALRAQLEWQLAVSVMVRAETGNTLAYLGRAVAIFTKLREHHNVAFLHNIISQMYDGARDRRRAAEHRTLALPVLGKTQSSRLVHAINGMVYDALQRQQWRAARSLMNVELAVNAEARDAELQTLALLRRARLHAHLGDRAAADSDLRAAAAVVASVTDDEHRAKLQTDRDAAAALISEDPHTAIPLLTRALEHHDTKGWRRQMPELYLRRGRMHRALGDRARAAADFEAGIVIVEQDRATLEKGEQRWGILDAAEELFDEAITEAVRDGAEQAFTYAERKRARSLADTQTDPFDPTRLPPGVVLIELASLPERLLVFTVDRDGYHVHESPLPRAQLLALASRFVDALRKGSAAERTGVAAELREHLIAPAWSSIAAHREVAFITDAATSSIPFAALPGSAGRMLVEDATISVSPSARVYLSSRIRGNRPRANLLLVDSPLNDALERLPGTSAEAKAVQREYARTRRLSGRDATRAAFIDESRGANVIHFGGHGLATIDSAAIVLTATADDAGFFDAASISHLTLKQTDVVVLAACDTARGPIRAAEGVLSVTHAFLHAGAPAVIATLWPLDDRDAADFFPRVHRRLARGVPAAEALRLAQLETIRSSPRDRAALWGAVQVAGY